MAGVRREPHPILTINAQALAAQILEKLPSDQLAGLAGKWSYSQGELADFRDRKSLGLKELITLSLWKLAGVERRAVQLVRRNPDSVVEAVTRAAFIASTGVDQGPRRAAAILNALDGVNTAVASTALTSWDPDNFGIIDRRAFRALHALTGSAAFELGNRALFPESWYQSYVELLRCVKQGTQLTCRDVDKALWVLGK